MAELLHLPDRAYPIMMLALGYPARSSANRPKKLTPGDMVFQETYPAFSQEEIIAAYEQKYGAITTVLPRDSAHREDMLQRLLASLRTSYTEQEAQAILTEVSEAGFLNEMQRRFGLHYACSAAAEQADHLMKDLALRHILFQSCGKGAEDEHSTAQAVQDVVRFGSVNKAAQANYTSPSTLSRSIRELEKTTRIVLFRRGHDGMQLTHQGEEFYMMVQPILNDLQQLERVYADENSIRDLLRLTMCVQQNSIAMECLIEFYNRYGAEAKYVDIVMAAYSSLEETIDTMMKKRFMLAIVQYNSVQESEIYDYFHHKHLQVLVRKSTQAHVVMNAEHPLAGRDSLTLEDLDGYTRICYMDETVPDLNYYTEADEYASARRRILIKERGQLIDLLEYTDAYFLGTGPSKLINENPRIRTIPLFGLENEPVTVLLGQQNYTLSRNAQRFVDIFRQVTESI